MKELTLQESIWPKTQATIKQRPILGTQYEYSDVENSSGSSAVIQGFPLCNNQPG